MDFFDPEKLADMNGKDGKPAYIVHDGKVYDVSGSKLWAGGTHMRIHQAGGDLSDHLPKAPHGTEVLERYPQVGVIRVVKEPAPEPRAVRTFSIPDRHPFLRRHPHPMVVHFPIALLMTTTLFYLLYLISGIGSLEVTALHCLAAGLISIPVGMATGYLTWHLNYESRPIRAVRIKIVLSWFLLAISLAALIWRLIDPEIAYGAGFLPLLYALLMMLLLPTVSAIGYYGGQLTMPIKRP